MKRFTRLQHLLRLAARIGADPADGDDLRLQKTLLVFGSFMFIPAGIIWGIIYFVFGELLAGAIPLSYSAVSTISIVIFAFTRNYRFLRFSQLLLILLLPFLLQVALGGFVNASAVIVWSLICPFGLNSTAPVPSHAARRSDTARLRAQRSPRAHIPRR